MALPVDFEKKIKLPSSVNGGYPYSIKAEDLMDNFKYCVIESDSSGDDEVILVIRKISDGTRVIRALMTNPSPPFPGGSNIDLRVNTVTLNLGANTISTSSATTADCWRNGLYVGRFNIGEEPTSTGDILIQTSSFVTGC